MIPEELKPHVVYRTDHAIAIMCPNRKEAHDVWKRWRDASELHAPIYIARIDRPQDPASEIVGVVE